ncbi:MAG TPA: SPOR domain-containing protein [Gammaproteobacteria bacterium]
MKERLIGAVVLAALAVWLIPWLLDGPDEPITGAGNALELPVPSGHVGEIRTEVIDLAARRDGGRSTEAAAGRADTASARPAEAESRDAPAPSAAQSAAAEDTAGGGDDGSRSTDDAATAASTATASSNPPQAAATNGRSTEPRTSAASGSAAAPASASGGSSTAAASARPTPAAPAESGDWAVQVGSFGEEENARRHADRISALGYSPKISTFRSGGRVLYRVRVGPHATRQAAEAVASALTAHGFVAQVVTAN